MVSVCVDGKRRLRAFGGGDDGQLDQPRRIARRRRRQRRRTPRIAPVRTAPLLVNAHPSCRARFDAWRCRRAEEHHRGDRASAHRRRPSVRSWPFVPSRRCNALRAARRCACRFSRSRCWLGSGHAVGAQDDVAAPDQQLDREPDAVGRCASRRRCGWSRDSQPSQYGQWKTLRPYSGCEALDVVAPRRRRRSRAAACGSASRRPRPGVTSKPRGTRSRRGRLLARTA